MTNFRLFQTERVCRRQFLIWRKWQEVIQTDRKHRGKRRNCSHSVFKRLVTQWRQKLSMCGNGLIKDGKCLGGKEENFEKFYGQTWLWFQRVNFYVQYLTYLIMWVDYVSFLLKRHGGLVVRACASWAGGCWFDSWQQQTKVFKNW